MEADDVIRGPWEDRGAKDRTRYYPDNIPKDRVRLERAAIAATSGV